jgi:hypothetical protein
MSYEVIWTVITIGFVESIIFLLWKYVSMGKDLKGDNDNYIPKKWFMKNTTKGYWGIIEHVPTDRKYPYTWSAGWFDRIKTDSGRCTTFESARETIKLFLKQGNVD